MSADGFGPAEQAATAALFDAGQLAKIEAALGVAGLPLAAPPPVLPPQSFKGKLADVPRSPPPPARAAPSARERLRFELALAVFKSLASRRAPDPSALEIEAALFEAAMDVAPGAAVANSAALARLAERLAKAGEPPTDGRPLESEDYLLVTVASDLEFFFTGKRTAYSFRGGKLAGPLFEVVKGLKGAVARGMGEKPPKDSGIVGLIKRWRKAAATM